MIDNPEDEAFNDIERMSSVRQEIVRSLNRKRQIQEAEKTFDLAYEDWKRNQVLDEVADEFGKFNDAFGVDTVASFAAFVRNMKK